MKTESTVKMMYPPWYIFGMKLSKRALPFRSWSFSTRKAAGHSLPHRRTVVWQMTTERLSGFIFSTRTMSAGAGTLPMRAMRSTPPAGESTSENSWFPIALVQAKNNGFKLMQFNAVVESNTHARHLYKRLGFVQVGMIPNGFLMKDGSYQNIFLYYHVL